MSNFKSLRSFTRGAIAWVLIFAAGFAFGQSEDSALRMVKTLRLGDNLAGLTYQFAKTTTTFKIVETTLGPQKADELLKAEMAVVLPKYREQWNTNLAQAWTQLMSAAEFDSVASDKQQSPFAGKFVALQDKAGATMKINSEPLLKTVLTEVLTGVFEKAMPKK